MRLFLTRRGRPSRWQVPAIAVVVLAAGCAATRPSEPAAGSAPAFVPNSAFGSYLAAGHAQSQHDYGEAAAFYDRALAADPGNDELVRRTFLLRVSDGRIAEAASLAQHMVQRDGRSGLAGVVLI